MHTYSIQNLAYQNLTLIDMIKYILRINLVKSKQGRTNPISGLFSLQKKLLKSKLVEDHKIFDLNPLKFFVPSFVIL